MNGDEKASLSARLSALSSRFQKDATPDQDTLDLLDDFEMDFEPAEPSEPLSWRRPKFTDWYIDLNSKTYNVHKGVLGDGARRSEFFAAQFGEQDHGTSKLDSLLPQECWGVWEQVMDFFYEGKFDPQPQNVLCYLKVGTLLKCKALFEVARLAVKSILGPQTAPQFVCQCLTLMPGMEKVLQASVLIVAKHLTSYSEDSFAALMDFPVDVAATVAEHAANYNAREEMNSHFITCYIDCHDLSSSDFVKLSTHTTCVSPEDSLKLLKAGCNSGDQTLINKVLPVVALNFDRLVLRLLSEDFASIPDHEVLCELLKTDTLSIQTEDAVFELIREYVNKRGSDLDEKQHAAIWNCCRFGLLAPQTLVEAHSHPGVSKHALQALQASLLQRVLKLEPNCGELLSTFEASCAEGDRQAQFLRARTPSTPNWLREQFRVSGNSAKLVWAASSVFGYGFVLRVSTSDGTELREVYAGPKNHFKINKLQVDTEYRATICALSQNQDESRQNELTFRTDELPDGFAFVLDCNQRAGSVNVESKGLTLSSDSEGSILGDMCLPRTGHVYWEVVVQKYDPTLNPIFDIGIACRGRDLKVWHYNSPDGWVLSVNSKCCTVKHHGRNLIRNFGDATQANTVWGILVDMETGTLSAWQDGKPLGVAFMGLDPMRATYPAFHVTQGVMLQVQHVAKDDWPEVANEPNELESL